MRADLIVQHGILTTFIGIERAPKEMTRPALRVSPHVDLTDDDLALLVDALAAVTRV